MISIPVLTIFSLALTTVKPDLRPSILAQYFSQVSIPKVRSLKHDFIKTGFKFEQQLFYLTRMIIYSGWLKIMDVDRIHCWLYSPRCQHGCRKLWLFLPHETWCGQFDLMDQSYGSEVVMWNILYVFLKYFSLQRVSWIQENIDTIQGLCQDWRRNQS